MTALSAPQTELLRRIARAHKLSSLDMHAGTRASLVRLGLIEPVRFFASGSGIYRLTSAGVRMHRGLINAVRAAERDADRRAAAEIASPDDLRAAAAGILAGIQQRGTTETLGCSCGRHSLTVTPYIFDESGRPDERVLWALVEIFEHALTRDDSHALTTLIPA